MISLPRLRVSNFYYIKDYCAVDFINFLLLLITKKLNFLPSFIITMEGKDFEAFAEQYPDLPASQVLKLWRVKQEKQEIAVSDIVDFKPLHDIISAIRRDDLERFIELVKIQQADKTFDPTMIECEIARFGRIRLMEWCFSNQSKYLAEREHDNNTFKRSDLLEKYRQNTWDVMQQDRHFGSAWFIAMQHEQYAFLRYLSSRIFPYSLWHGFINGSSQMADSGIFDVNKISIDVWLFLAGLVIVKNRKPQYNVFPAQYAAGPWRSAAQGRNLVNPYHNPSGTDHPMYHLIRLLLARYVERLPYTLMTSSHYEITTMLKQVINRNSANFNPDARLDVEKLIVYVEQRAVGNYSKRHINQLLVSYDQNETTSSIEGEQ